MKCLLIETKDKRVFFTHETNLLKIQELSNIFNAEIFHATTCDNTKLLDLQELATAFCDSSYKSEPCEYKKLKSQITLTSKKRTEILEIAEKIKQYITNQFISNKSVSLKNLKDKFPSLTSATLCNHIRRAKIILEAKGYKFVKSSAGTYRISKYV